MGTDPVGRLTYCYILSVLKTYQTTALKQQYRRIRRAQRCRVPVTVRQNIVFEWGGGVKHLPSVIFE